MVLYLPETFDENEWFILTAMVIALTIAWLLPRRFPFVLSTVIYVLNVYLAQTVDSWIAVKPIDLYDVSDGPRYELMDVVIYYFVYPPVAYLFLYGYDKWRLTGWLRTGYVVGFSLFTAMLEWISSLFHVFAYKGWHVYYSPIVYVAVYALNIVVLNWARKHATNGIAEGRR